MKLLPPAGPERRRLILMITVLVVGAGLYWQFGGGPEYPIAQSTGPAPTSNMLVGRGRGTSSKPAPPTVPQALRLAEIDHVPDEPDAGRNLFRFGVKPLPPPPPPIPYVAPPPPPPPPPPPIPAIPLNLIFIVQDPEQPTRNRAYLTDAKGNPFEAFQGEIVDGRYRLLRVGTTEVVMCYLDGTGQRIIRVGR